MKRHSRFGSVGDWMTEASKGWARRTRTLLLLVGGCGAIWGDATAADQAHYTIDSARADYSAISTDGKWIAYRKDSSEIWVVKRSDLSYRRMVSVSTDGTAASPVGMTRCAAISGNGRFVAFISGTRFCQGDPLEGQRGERAYAHDRDTDCDGVFDEPGATRTMLLSNHMDLVTANKYYITISANGEWAAFSNSGSGDGREAVVRLGGGYKVTEDQYMTSFSGNGQYCVYTGGLFAGSPNETLQVLMRMPMAAGPGNCVSTAPSGTMANDWSSYPNFSPDGNHLAFYSRGSNLTLNDLNAHNWDVFVKNLFTGEVVRCTAGIANTGDGHTESLYVQASVSEGGRFVAFMSDSPNLVANVTPQSDRIFVYDTLTTETGVCSPASADFAWSPSISGDGRYVVYTVGNGVYMFDRGVGYAQVVARIADPAGTATLESATLGARVDFEANTFKEPVMVEMTAEIMELMQKSPLQLGGSSMGVGVVGPSAPSRASVLSANDLAMYKPYRITYSYLDQDLGTLAENDLALCFWDEVHMQWIREPTSTLAMGANVVTASHTGGETWCLMALPKNGTKGWAGYR